MTSNLPEQISPAVVQLTANHLHQAGLTVIPVTMPTKSPAIKAWKQFQSQKPSDLEHQAMFDSNDHRAIALICGKTSGNVEVIDIDTKHDPTGQLYDAFCELLEQFVPGLLERLMVQQTVSGGYHLIYRCTTIESNQKIATTADNKCIIETRGEGGYIVIAPTTGYAVLAGDFTNIPMISPEERAGLIDCACSFHVVKEENTVAPAANTFTNGSAHLLTAGDDFNQRGDIMPLLRIEGWIFVYERNSTEYWRRPGKRSGVSATFNHGGSGKFYVFSSNAAPFDSGRAYSKFAVFTFLKHNGDFKAAAKDLAASGFGEKQVRQIAQLPEQMTLDGEPEKTPIGKIEDYLLRCYNFRWNEITRRTEFRKADVGAFRTINDRDFGSICRELEHRKLKYALEKLRVLLESDFSPLHNPFSEYFASLPAHDGTDYIQQLAGTVKIAHDMKESWELYLKKWMVAHVATVLGRGTNHTTLLLAGPQGVGKTSWLNRLVPEVLNPDYLYVGTINPENKDTMLLIAQKWMINLDEFEALSKYEIGHLKSIMTQNHLDTRKAWGRFNETYRRVASFVGSVNKNQFLTDDTGNRRFLAVTIEEIDYQHSINIDKCYAQALFLLNEGYRYYFDAEEIVKTNKLNEKYATTSIAEELFNTWFEILKWDEANNTQKLSSTQIAAVLTEKAKVQLTQAFTKELGSALKKLGCERKAFGKGYAYAVRQRDTPYTGDASPEYTAPF